MESNNSPICSWNTERLKSFAASYLPAIFIVVLAGVLLKGRLFPDGAPAPAFFAPTEDIGPIYQPEIAPPNPVDLRRNDYTPETVQLDGRLWAVTNKTKDWDSLMSQAFSSAKGDALADIHFNRYRGQNSGPMVLYSESGKALAASFQREFIEIYEENGWAYDKEMDIRRPASSRPLGLITRGDSQKKPVVILEFGYVDDPKNPIGEYIQSLAGQLRIARAIKNAVRGLGYEKVILSPGHHRDQGTPGAKYQDYHETDFAFDLLSAIQSLGTSEVTNQPAPEYPHTATGEVESVDPPVEKTEEIASPEDLVFSGATELRTPSADYMGNKPEPAWTPVETSNQRTTSSNETKKRIGLFSRVKQKKNCKT